MCVAVTDQITEAHLGLFERTRSDVHRALLPALIRQELKQLRSMASVSKVFEPLALCMQVECRANDPGPRLRPTPVAHRPCPHAS